MSFPTNYFIDGLARKQNYNIKHFIFETFKRINIFWKLRDEDVANLNKQQFIELIKKNAYQGKDEISVERFNEMQDEIKCVNDFYKQIPSVKMTTQLHYAKVSSPPWLHSFVPKELYTKLDSFDSELAPLEEAYEKDWNNSELAAKVHYLRNCKNKYLVEVQMAYWASLTPKQKETIFKKIQNAEIAYCQDQIAEHDAAKARYMEALEILKNWNITAEFQDIKDYLIKLVKEGISHLRSGVYEQELEEYKNMTSEQFFEKEQNQLLRRYKSLTSDIVRAKR